MLTVENLTKLYRRGEQAGGGIRDASFSLQPGAFFTLLGPSGCGKTTTLRCIAGLNGRTTASSVSAKPWSSMRGAASTWP